jgi:ATP/maltotriose-dependent transcriptional regulator MalT
MADGYPVVIRTKLVPPVRDSGLVVRDRLLAQLTDLVDRTVVIVKAPAGYGKTTLVGQWFTKLDPTVHLGGWYSLDVADNELGRFFTYLVAALRLKEENFGATILGQLNAGVRLSPGSLSGAFLNEIAILDRRVHIVLDDSHLIHNSDITDAMAQIVENAPANLQLIFVSRETPQLSLGRLRVLNRVVEINGDELRFRGLETGNFLSLAGHTELSTDQIHTLEKHTEGWAAGLQLASISLLNREDIAKFIAAFSGSYKDVAEFLTEDVFRRQDDETREFLLQTSILDRLCPSLCNAITDRNNSRHMLDNLESRSLFLFSLDDDREWYRYHNLFSDFLRKYLNTEKPNLANELHVRASEWFASQNFIDEAIQHALAGKDMERAARFLNQACDDLFYSGRLSTLAEWYKQIPEAHLHRYPRILLDQAWSVILEWRFALARRMLDDVHAILQEQETGGGSEIELGFLRSLLKHREMMFALFRDDMPHAERLCQEMLQDFPVTDPYLRGNLYTCLIYAQREMFNFNSVNTFDAQSLQLYEEANSRFVLIWHYSILGPTEIERGNLDQAEESLTLARSIASEISGELSPLAAMPGILLAEVFYERNQLEKADDLLNLYLPISDQIGFVDQLIAGYICRARLLVARGADTDAIKLLKEAKTLAVKRDFRRFEIHAEAEHARQLILARDHKMARHLFREMFKQTNPDSLCPGTHVISSDAIKALSWCRLAIVEGHLNEAAAVSRKWIRFAKNRRALRTAMQFNVLLAHILQQSGDARKSMRALREALVSAMSTGFVRTITDEMKNNISLLTQFVQGQHSADDPVLNYANQLLKIIADECGQDIPASSVNVEPLLVEDLPVELLSEREREVLQLVAGGLLNREIAESLCMTEGSVKWYLQQIYDKLGTRRRAQAVQRARDLGFIR